LRDENNCGSCGNVCTPPKNYCGQGTCQELLTFSGVKNNFSQAQLAGWNQCHKDLYRDSGKRISTIKNDCSKGNVLIACKKKGSSTIYAAAHAPRNDVFTDTGTGDSTHQANGVEWYFSPDYSWGFAPKGESVDRNSCDVNQRGDDKRLCWHTGSGDLQGGWRCGSNTSLNTSSDWVRLIYHAD
ncbi:MAG: hypothetical protein ABEN55_23215, partial [Bradymonadaceae bacterium]